MADNRRRADLATAEATGRDTVRRVRNRLRRITRNGGRASSLHPELDDGAFVDWAYREVLGRPADDEGRALYVAELAGGWDREQLLNALRTSPEARSVERVNGAMSAFHESRVAWTRSLPRGKRILDLGGTALHSDIGALLVMGYPYDFEELIIIELPPEDRHELYQVPEMKSVDSDHGPVRYRYQSMTDLENFEDQSFDLVCSGQTFEHITADDGAKLLHDVRRVLTPDGFLALDTPNRALTAIQTAGDPAEFINPDHKIEYTHQQMRDLFADAGLRVVRQHGVGYMPESAATGVFQIDELKRYPGLYDDIERSYTLAYVATPA